MYYLTIKALHIIAFTAWMAGMFYLPRLFVYHAQVQPGTESYELFKVMEKRLLRAIINPAMAATILFGILLIIETGYGAPGRGGWIHAKIVLILALGAMHGLMAKYRKDFEREQNTKTARYYKIFNEIPTLIFIAIVLLAVLKPF